MVSEGTVSALLVGVTVVIVGSMLTASGKAKTVTHTIATAPQPSLSPPPAQPASPEPAPTTEPSKTSSETRDRINDVITTAEETGSTVLVSPSGIGAENRPATRIENIGGRAGAEGL